MPKGSKKRAKKFAQRRQAEVGQQRKVGKAKRKEFRRKEDVALRRLQREHDDREGMVDKPDDVAAWMERGELAAVAPSVSDEGTDQPRIAVKQGKNHKKARIGRLLAESAAASTKRKGVRAAVGPSRAIEGSEDAVMLKKGRSIEEMTSAREFFDAFADESGEESGSASSSEASGSDSENSSLDSDVLHSASDVDRPEGEEEDEGVDDADAKSMRRQIVQHKRELAELEEADPEFAAFLRENNDAALLEFDESISSGADESDSEEDAGGNSGSSSSSSDADDDIDIPSDADDDEKDLRRSVAAELNRLAGGAGGSSSSSDGEVEDDQQTSASDRKEALAAAEAEPTPLRLAELERWKDAAENGSVASIKKLMQAFRSACHMTDVPDEETQRRLAAAPLQYSVSNTAVFNNLMAFVLQELPIVLIHDHLTPKNASKASREAIAANPVKNSPNFQRLKQIYKSLLGNLLHFMKSLADDNMSLFLLRALEQRSLLMMFAGFPALCKKLLKLLLGLWTSANDESVRILAYVCIRGLALNMPKPFADTCLKAVYLAFVRNCKFTNAKSMPVVNLMRNCVVELFNSVALDSHRGEDSQSPAAYRHAFVYIRQLAISLRDAITGKSGNAFQNVYSWQFVHSLRVWTQLLAELHSQQREARSRRQKMGLGDMPHLVYPLVQVLFGAASLVPTARFIPVRFHCIDMLHDLAAKCDTFLNTLPLLMQILENSTVFGGQLTSNNAAAKAGRAQGKRFSSKPVGSKSFDFSVSLKAPKNELNTSNYEVTVATHASLRLLRYFEIFGSHISLPELAFPISTFLARWIKQHGSAVGASGVRTQPQTRQVLQQALDAIRQQSDIVLVRRQSSAPGTFAPRNLEQIALFSSNLQQNFAEAAAAAAGSKRQRRKKAKEGITQSPVSRAAAEIRDAAGRAGALGFDSLQDTTVYDPLAPSSKEEQQQGDEAMPSDDDSDSSSSQGEADDALSSDGSGSEEEDASSGSEEADESMDGDIETDSDGEVVFVPRSQKKKVSGKKEDGLPQKPSRGLAKEAKKSDLSQVGGDDVMQDLELSDSSSDDSDSSTSGSDSD